MSEIDQTLKEIRPRMRLAIPQTFWLSICFGIFNVVIGTLLSLRIIALHLVLLGVIPIVVWGFVFILHGVCTLSSLMANSWDVSRGLHFAGLAIKSAWWLELMVGVVVGNNPAYFVIWSLLLAVQFVVWFYFSPRVKRGK